MPVLFIDEKKYCHSVPSSTPMLKALKESFSNRNFFFFIVACLSYFMSISLILNGLLYFVTVLAGIPQSQGPKLIGFMVILSLFFYPLLITLLIELVKKARCCFPSFLLLSSLSGISSIGKSLNRSQIAALYNAGMAAFPWHPLAYYLTQYWLENNQ